MSQNVSPRVNSARIAAFIGGTVRLPCKVLSFTGDTATVKASDDGEVLVQITSQESSKISQSTYVEVVGTAVDANTIRMISCVNLGGELDMTLVDRTIQLIHDPRYFSKIFS